MYFPSNLPLEALVLVSYLCDFDISDDIKGISGLHWKLRQDRLIKSLLLPSSGEIISLHPVIFLSIQPCIDLASGFLHIMTKTCLHMCVDSYMIKLLAKCKVRKNYLQNE